MSEGVDKTKCYLCKAKDPTHEVAEVWFDLGEPNMRLASTADWRDKPRLCDACFEARAHEVAQTVAVEQSRRKAFGPLKPVRWWLRYEGEPSFGDPDFRPLGGTCTAVES